MEKSSATRIVRQTFQNPFDKESFVYFIKSLLNHIEPAPFIYRGNLIPDAYESYIKTLERIGKYQDKDDKKIDLLIVRLKKETSLERARTMQRNFIAWYLNGSRGDILKDAALVAFVSPNLDEWRFSLVKMDYRLDASGEKAKVQQELTPARRFSFLVGKTESSHTAQSRLVPILQDDSQDPNLQDLEEAFSIEKVTKEFFEKYRELFLKVKEALDEVVKKDRKVKQDFETKDIDTVNFAKKLLGQVVFLYFLQKKGWFGVERNKDWGTGPKNFLRLLFEKGIVQYDNFFNEILEPLFYEALRHDRSYDDHYFSYFKCKIPFLNGGLFDPINDYDWSKTDILLPNKLFSNDEKTKEGDIGTGILDIFDRYNFTVKEDEPLEKEVAIDPEMLGKVFENLLEVKDRKSKGTYYTPREIVHYMCQQSLINYLATELKGKVKKEDIETLIKYGETVVEHDNRVVKQGKETKTYSFKLPKNIRDNTKLIDEKLASIRVCDPAVGSGAFPVGMMNEVIRTRNALTNYLKDKKKRTIYDFKRHAIQNCLYGVDIDLGAVEIAKLRLWLSLIVDEEDIKQIKPLPNLDYKIIQGNSLIELLSPEVTAKTLDHERNTLVDELVKAKNEFFEITSAAKKIQKKQEIELLLKKIFEHDKNTAICDLEVRIRGIRSQGRLFVDRRSEKDDKQKILELEKKIKEIKAIKAPGPAEHFEWHINFSEVFQEKDGFDVVIANPPYVDYRKIDSTTKKGILRYDSSRRTKMGNLYIYFIELGIKISNKLGIVCYINPHQYLTSDSTLGLREFLVKNTSIIRIVDLSDLRVFESVSVYTSINFFTSRIIEGNKIQVIKPVTLTDLYHVDFELPQREIKRDTNFLIILNTDKELLEKIETNSKKLELFCNIFVGSSSSSSSRSKINQGEFMQLNERRNKFCLFIQSSNIHRYFINRSGQYISKDEYPKGIREKFQEEKIFLARMTKDIKASYSNLEECAGKVNVLVDFKEDPKYVLGLLNSKLINYWYKSKFESRHLAGGYLGFDIPSVKSIPMKISRSKKSIIKIVDKILAITKNDDYLENPAKQAKVREYEKQIDQLVYKLYELTPEEIKIIERE